MSNTKSKRSRVPGLYEGAAILRGLATNLRGILDATPRWRFMRRRELGERVKTLLAAEDFLRFEAQRVPPRKDSVERARLSKIKAEARLAELRIQASEGERA